MNNHIPFLSIFISLMLPGVSAAESGVLLRPHGGIGKLDGSAYQHAGMRLLLNANDIQKYGLELTSVNTPGGNYIATGIVLEQRLYGWLNMSIGSIGYFGQGQSSRNYPGLVANVGWEPITTGAVKPFVTLRQDFLFIDTAHSGTAVSAGLSVNF